LLIFAAGVALMALALLSPLDAIAEEYLLSGHMLQHVLIGDAAAALIVLGVRGPLVFFLLPRSATLRLGRLAPLRAVIRFLLRPQVSFAFWALSLALWHIPRAYEYALTHPVVHDVEHASFVFTGVLVWTQLIDPARRRALQRGGRLVLAVILFACGQVLADVLVFSFDPLYGAYAAQDERLLGLTALADQRLAGVVMMAEQLLTLGTCITLLLLGAHREAAGRDGRATAAGQGYGVSP